MAELAKSVLARIRFFLIPIWLGILAAFLAAVLTQSKEEAAAALIRNASKAELMRLGPSASVAEVAAALEVFGVVAIERRASEGAVREALAELQEGRMAEASVRFGRATQLLKSPLDPGKERAVKALADDPLVLAAAERVRPLHGVGSERAVGWEVRLLILRPGTEAGDLHRDVADSSRVPLERPLQWGLNAIWAVDNFTVTNGATRFVPGSHCTRWPQGSWLPDEEGAEGLAEVAAMPAGSLVLYYASVLHGSGQNGAEAPRTGLNFNYAFVDAEGGRPAGWGW